MKYVRTVTNMINETKENKNFQDLKEKIIVISITLYSL